ncbi:MAG: hypothetical protein M1133_04330 [Armatimonadetes bacterium]|nr:hypothetical protein [Armatimonadota bacterium]
MKKGKIGLFAGGIEGYWTDTGMKDLPALLDSDAKRLARLLENDFEIIYPGFAQNVAEAERIGNALRNENVDIALVYHATYVDDAMSLAFLDNLGATLPVLLLSQGIKGIPSDVGLIDAGRCWGNNSMIQLTGTLKRMRPDFKYGLMLSSFDNPMLPSELAEYVRAAKAVRKLKKSTITYLPHRSAAVPMYDTFPDDTLMMAQTGVRITYEYTSSLIEAMSRVTDKEAQDYCKELRDKCEIVEPTDEEIYLAAKQAIALEKVVDDAKIDALAIDMFPELTPKTGMIPCVGMARLIDKGTVVATEGDLGVSVAGLIIRELTGKPIHFWEHLMFDEEKNWFLGGHEGGSAGFNMAKKGTKPRLRNTQYINFGGMPGAPYNGVLPEFITDPGPVTLLTLFNTAHGYEMRVATGESVDTSPRPVHFEHTIFRPSIPLKEYFVRTAEAGVCHHYGLVHAEITSELKKVASILGMKYVCLTENN